MPNEQSVYPRSALLKLLFLMLYSMPLCRLHAATIRVPDNQLTIQAAITAAIDGETILLVDGVSRVRATASDTVTHIWFYGALPDPIHRSG